MATSPASWIRNEWYGSVWKKLKVTAAATAVVIAAARLIKAATTTMIASDTPTIVDPTSPRTVDVAAPTATATAGPATTATRANRVRAHDVRCTTVGTSFCELHASFASMVGLFARSLRAGAGAKSTRSEPLALRPSEGAVRPDLGAALLTAVSESLIEGAR